jgi:hypothetical protein
MRSLVRPGARADAVDVRFPVGAFLDVARPAVAVPLFINLETRRIFVSPSMALPTQGRADEQARSFTRFLEESGLALEQPTAGVVQFLLSRAEEDVR